MTKCEHHFTCSGRALLQTLSINRIKHKNIVTELLISNEDLVLCIKYGYA